MPRGRGRPISQRGLLVFNKPIRRSSGAALLPGLQAAVALDQLFLCVAEGLKLQAKMASIVPDHGFHPDGLSGRGKMYFQGDDLAYSHALNSGEAEAAFRNAIGMGAQGGYLLLPNHADYERYLGLEPG